MRDGLLDQVEQGRDERAMMGEMMGKYTVSS
jgi:hypothetical protein